MFVVDEYGTWDEEAQAVLDKYIEENPDFVEKYGQIMSSPGGKNLFYEIYKKVKEEKK